MLYKQKLAILMALALNGGFSVVSTAQDVLHPASAATDSGFYGGIVLREHAQDTTGVRVGYLDSAWAKFVAPTTDDATSRALLFGGYRFRSDLAVEAAFATAESYALTPSGRRGVGLSLASSADGSSRSWNADVYTSWSFRRTVALYGRLGYAQQDITALYSPGGATTIDPRRGVNYGVGLRYDVTPALGLRLEYARFARLAGETVNGVLPESDQVQFGMQYRF